jgi:hypothetical protein
MIRNLLALQLLLLASCSFAARQGLEGKPLRSSASITAAEYAVRAGSVSPNSDVPASRLARWDHHYDAYHNTDWGTTYAKDVVKLFYDNLVRGMPSCVWRERVPHLQFMATPTYASCPCIRFCVRACIIAPTCYFAWWRYLWHAT